MGQKQNFEELFKWGCESEENRKQLVKMTNAQYRRFIDRWLADPDFRKKQDPSSDTIYADVYR